MEFGVLGPVRASDGGAPVALKGPVHRAVLARLLAARGRVVPLDRLIADLWEGDPPRNATGAVRTFVADLRRALEPDRPPRAPARLLVTVPPGYALRAQARDVDARRFESAVDEARGLLAPGADGAERAFALLDGALRLWRGPAYAEFADRDWARGEAARLEGRRLIAVELRARAALELGRAEEAVPVLQQHTAEHPHREDGWRLLALALYRTAGQGEALAALRRARASLADGLGLDPGPRLRRLEADILAQDPALLPGAGPGEERRTESAESPEAPSEAPPEPVGAAGSDEAAEASAAGPGTDAPALYGRDRELRRLEEAARRARDRNRLVPVLVSGEAGAGKTALTEALAARLADRGWASAFGPSPENTGVPPAWPWSRILAALPGPSHGDLDAVAVSTPRSSPWESAVGGDPGGNGAAQEGARRESAAAPAGLGGPVPGAAGSPFRLGRAVAARLAEAAARRPVLVVLDDLQWAGEETLEALTALVEDPPPGPVLLLAAHRSTGIPAALTAALGRLARAEPVRVHLGGLSEGAVADLVRAEAGADAGPEQVRAVARRSGGNPFFAGELARLLGEAGPGALAAVPAGVRDVVRHRMAALPEEVRAVLGRAAVIGREVDIDLLAALAGEEPALRAAEDAARAGFAVEEGPDRFRFAHDLVREALYEDISAVRRARLHLRAGEALERLRPGDPAALAHHFLRAAGRDAAPRAARYARAAAEQAERRFAPHEAARLWQGAEQALERSDGPARDRLEAAMGAVRALAVTGDLERARAQRGRAIAAAERIGDPRLTAEVVGAFEVPANWPRNDDEELSRQVVAAAERSAAALPEGERAARSRLLSAIAMESRGTAGGGGRDAARDRGAVREAAREAERLARACGDPGLLALALNGRFMQSFHRAGLAPERARIGEELVDLAARSDGGLVPFEVLGRLVLVQSRSARADFAAADEHAAAADRLAAEHGLPLVGVFTDWYWVLRLAVAGRAGEAEAGYRAASARLAGSGMTGVEKGLLPLALLCLRLQTGGAGAASVDLAEDWGPYRAWVEPLAELGRGEREAARGRLRSLPEQPPADLLLEALTCLEAVVAVELGERAVMERAYARLLPAAEELAGAGTGMLSLRPVAYYLGDLAAALGDTERAADHYRQARALGEQAGAQHWEKAAEQASPRRGAS
ncbi:BTAD domain-containing putative transcriptional regulator [Nocardiopsis potens]|uniref:BTAD domain-containing putative transcriptional regulator n=1 Tax=Nocardiopsis potens TaxID=1246458 RepID=UPI00034ACD63|nr:BTAD domain-containing putative transcriptional regulator [Nocardiopsis potens]